ncbi:GH25 family lysozyme [Lactiplantibacillus plantarum]|uniref:GH25 family lysozyme n=1 Tax=Lactiplantibacillus plantarum TaxID=1590 RepID=UPI000A8304F8|nr:GH25 family lysozyme [Lactiplantibacillus plantarum]
MGQKVSSSNNKSHEATAHTTSAASGSINQVSSTAIKSATSTENTNKATSVASNAAKHQAKTTKKADLNLTTVTASTPETDVWTIGDTTRPCVDVVDVASYQSAMTQSDYNKLKAAGVKTVIIKTTEGTGYTNPVALAQAKMANAAGLNVDFYHYATFNTADTAQMEATNMANFLVKNNVSKKVLLFAYMEDAKTYTVNATANLNTFWSVLNALGYTNHGVYTSNTYLYRDAVIKTVGQSRVWRAQYPYTPAANNLWNTDDGAWQFSSTALLPSGSDYTGYIDVSICYNGLTEDSAGTNTFSTPNEFVKQSHWEGNKLYFYGSNGQPITGFRHYGNNKLEYYGTDHIQYRNRFATVGNNKLYYFGSNGDAISKSQADNQIASSTAATPNTKPATQVRLMATSSAAMKIKPITYKIQSKQMTRNQYQWQGNNLYYYGNDGQPITGLRHYSNNKLEYYGTDHVQYRNSYANVGNTRYYFGSNGDAVSTNRPQTEADIIGSMRVAQKAQQIVTVVQDGESTATLKLWQKQGDTWRNILISSSRIGNGGIGNSHEGSSTTPKGVYHLSFAFGKGATAQTAGMSYRQIKPTSYWIEDQNDRQYNTWQDRSWANNKNEHLIDYTKAAPHNQYELVVVMDNQGQNNGSGFFIHVKNQWPTEGCVSISLSDMRTLVSHLGTKAYVVDVQNQAQLKNY